MFPPVDERLFRARVAAPEDEYEVFALFAENADHVVGEPCPAAVLVRVGAVRPHGQRGVQEENALLCPFGQIARFWNGAAHVRFEFFEDIDKRRGRFHALFDRKA